MNHLRAQWRAAINKRDYSPTVMWRGQTVELREPERTQFLDAWRSGATRVMRDLALEAVVSNPVDRYQGAGGWWTEFRNEAELFGMTFNDNWERKKLYVGMLMGAHLPKDFRNTNHPGGSSWALGTPIVIEKLFLSLPRPPDVYGRESWVEVPIPLMETTTVLATTIYRGIQLPIPDEMWDRVTAWLRPPMEDAEYGQRYKIGPMVIEHLQRGYDDGYGNVGLGRHWTTDRHMAEIATTHGNVGRGPTLGVVLTATYSPTDVDETQTGTTKWMAESESEVTLRPQARITITDVEVPEGALAYSFISVLDRPMQATAHRVHPAER